MKAFNKEIYQGEKVFWFVLCIIGIAVGGAS